MEDEKKCRVGGMYEAIYLRGKALDYCKGVGGWGGFGGFGGLGGGGGGLGGSRVEKAIERSPRRKFPGFKWKGRPGQEDRRGFPGFKLGSSGIPGTL